MISSAAVTAVPARVHIGAAAEAPTSNSKKPRPVGQHRNGARKTASSHNASKEHATYGNHDTDRGQEEHDDHPPRREDRDDHQAVDHRRRLLMTAVPLEAPIVDFDKVSEDIAAVLVAHGVVAPENIRITLTTLGHGDRTGLQVTAFGDPATTRPHGREDDVFDAIVGQIREAS